MKVRRFVRGMDELAWATLTGLDWSEFRELMSDPEFDDEGMLVGEIDGQVVGIVNAHISPSYPKFCVLRDFRVEDEHWTIVAPFLLDAALNSFVQRNANIAEACFPEEAEKHLSLLKNRGFEIKDTDCKMVHDLENIPLRENPRVLIKRFWEVRNSDLVVNLQNEIFAELISRPVTKEEFMFWMKNPKFECFVAFFDDKPVASSFCEIKTAKNKKEGWIYGLGVLPRYRRKKVGTTLLSTILKHLKSKGADHAFIETDYNSYQQRFYESAGFHIVNKIICLRKSLKD